MTKPIIPHSRPTIGQAEIEAVSKVIASGQIAQGSEVTAFEEEFAHRMGVKYAAAVSSGTAALHLSLLSLDVSQGDEVIIPSFVCTALINAVNYIGAKPVIADIDPISLNIDPRDVANRITSNTKAIIIPHMFGLMADMAESSKLGIPLIEDCAQAVGASHNGYLSGSLGRIGVYSFYATKVMTSGEGGMVVSNEESLIERIKDFREYDNQVEYAVRYNYKMTDLQAAMGRRQLDYLDDFIARRRKIAAKYYQAFERLSLRLPPADVGHIYYRYNLNVGSKVGEWIEQMQAAGIACAKPVYKPLHHYFADSDCPNADEAYSQTLSIPIYPSLSDNDVERTVKAITEKSTRFNT